MIIFIMIPLAAAIVGAAIAAGKGRTAFGWFFLCLLLPFTVIIVMCVPNKRMERAQAQHNARIEELLILNATPAEQRPALIKAKQQVQADHETLVGIVAATVVVAIVLCSGMYMFVQSQKETAPVVAAAATSPLNIPSLINEELAANNLCRGTRPGDPRQAPACDRRALLDGQLAKAGWCWGRAGEIEANKVWHKCND